MDRKKIIAFIEKYRNQLEWYHTIDLGGGIKTPGMYDHRPYLKHYGFPDDLSGKRVLDIGTSNGFFAFEFEKRGAEEIVGIDIGSPRTFNFCKEVLGLKARYVKMSIYDLNPSQLGGPFDLVFCGSLLLHLDDIVGAMRKIRLMTKETAIVVSAYFRTRGEDFPLFYSPLQMQALKGLKGEAKKEEITFPLTWLGNKEAYQRLFEYVGFEQTQIISTFLLSPVDKHNFKLDTKRGLPHIVIHGNIEIPTKPRYQTGKASLTERLAGIRKEVIGSFPPPKDMDIFTPEESEELVELKEENMKKDLNEITIQYPIISTRRIVGPIIIFVKRVFGRLLWPVFEQINPVLNTHQTYLSRLTDSFEYLANRLTESFEYLAARIDSLLEETSKIHEETSQLLEKHNERIKQLEELKISQRLNRFERWMRGQDKDEKQTDRESLKAKKGKRKAEISKVDLPGMDYYLFEEKFRGDEKLIADRQRRYLEIFRNSDKVLDIGCGRGEFLEILKKNKVNAYGIDLDEDMVRLCKEKGLEVYKEDALSHLERIAPDTLGGVFLAQVVEHLSLKELSRLIHLSFSRLKGGGLFVAETLNPDSLSAMELFYLDPSHVRPFPSKTFEFFLETAGFSDIRIDFLNPATEQLELMEIPPHIINKLQRDQLEQINRNLKRLNERLFGPIDYAIIASKKGSD